MESTVAEYPSNFVTRSDSSTSTRPWSLLSPRLSDIAVVRIHGDPHLGNLFLNAAGLPCLLDWQLVQRGCGTSMWVTTSPRHSRSTTVANSNTSYCGTISGAWREHGVEPPPWDAAWRAVSRGIVHGFFLWSITTQVEPGLSKSCYTVWAPRSPITTRIRWSENDRSNQTTQRGQTTNWATGYVKSARKPGTCCAARTGSCRS